jgi:serine/threonine protein kinase
MVKPTVIQGHTFTIAERYVPKSILGRGSFGVVCTAVDKETNNTIAVKRIRPYANDEWDAKHTIREVRLMRLFKDHPNVISLYNLSLYDEKSELYMFMELMDCDLHRVSSEAVSSFFSTVHYNKHRHSSISRLYKANKNSRRLISSALPNRFLKA